MYLDGAMFNTNVLKEEEEAEGKEKIAIQNVTDK